MTRLLPTIALVLFHLHVCMAGPRDQLWQEVSKARDQGLPRTAISYLEQIIPAAIQDQAWAEATKAICLKVVYECQIEGYMIEEGIRRLQPLIETVPEPMRPCMEVILGHWYAQYFLANRWRFMQRTATAQPPGQDITTWDLATILKEIDRHYTKALAAEDFLRSTPVGVFSDLLLKGTVPDTYRPTLYDFVVFEVLSFYSVGELALVRPMDAYDMTTDSPIFDPVDQFLAWQLQAMDQDSVTIKAIKLYQDLLRFHQDDPDPTAFIDADLHRLQFGYNKAVGPDKEQRYIAALRAFADRWQDHEISATAIYYWAAVVNAQGDPLSACQIAQEGLKAFPESYGGRCCHNLIQDIQAKSLEIQTEWTWSEPLPHIQVRYKNIKQIHFRLVPFSIDWKTLTSHYPWDLGRDQLRALLDQQPAYSWSSALPETPDYRQRTVYLTAGFRLQPGFYWLIASSDPDFTEDDNVVSYTAICATDLALVVRAYRPDLECLVLQACEGLPAPGAMVSVWQWSWSEQRWIRQGSGQTDANGLAKIQWEVPGSSGYDWITVEYNGQCLVTASSCMTNTSNWRPGRYQRTILFTDRAIYRPGQTIMYKGICISIDPDSHDYKTLSGKQITVALRDTNYQVIATQKHLTNEYGSFSGSFTAPEDRLLGEMSIEVWPGPEGTAKFSVEEYKRPTFMVQLDQPAVPPHLGGPVTISGMATAYTGAAVDGAQVRWRVERRTRLPFWYWWYIPYADTQAIAHGSARTDAEGVFTIEFEAKPDLSVPESAQPVFEFMVYADVTDRAGETRSRSVRIPIGYTALEVDIQADQWLTPDRPVQLAIKTTSLAGDGKPASGTLAVYSLKQPEQVVRPSLFASDQQARDPSDPNTWDLAEEVYEGPFQTDSTGQTSVEVPLGPGSYRAVVSTQDPYGMPVTGMLTFHVIDPQADRFPIKIPFFVQAPRWSIEPGQEFVCLWGTGYQTGRAFVEVECKGSQLQAGWTDPGRTQQLVRVPVTEQMRGGFTIRLTYVRQNRAYLFQRVVDVPWTNKNLSIRWEHFRSLLAPGERQTWSLVVQGPDAKAAVAEVLAAMYDASLDQFVKHSWTALGSVFRQEYASTVSIFDNKVVWLGWGLGHWYTDYKSAILQYRQFVPELGAYATPLILGVGAARGGDAAAPDANGAEKTADATGPTASSESLDISQYSVRKDLNETAFFYPHLVSDSDGVVRIEFTMPEALTRWRFMALAHDRQVRSGFLTDTAVTAKDLMVQPNPPRFVREGDSIEFTVKISNRSATSQTGRVSLTFTDACTGSSMDQALGNTSGVQTFEIPSRQSRSISWRISIPDGCGVLVYKAIAVTDALSDGQEGYLPVLSRRILVRESMTLPVRGPQTKQFEFTSLLEAGRSETLRHQSLTVQVTSQPAWYAVMALPYLMEPSYTRPVFTISLFHCLYANALARYIANSDPKIRQVFDLWKGTDALDSPLEKDQDLKDLLLQETPWVVQARDESQARRNVGILFDKNRLDNELERLTAKLAELQYANGLWPWIEGGPGNEYITLLIVAGIGRLRHMGASEIDTSLALKAISALDSWADRRYREIIKGPDPQDNHLTPIMAFYLYARSFFLQDRPVPEVYRPAIDYWLDQGRHYWTSLWRQSQAHLALGLSRFGDTDTPLRILASIKEFSVTSEELGMYWRDTERSWYWYRAPIQTQALMIEAFEELANDRDAVEDCKVWLIKQKQTQDWGTTCATADAIYAILLRGQDLLVSNALMEISLAGQWIQPSGVEAGTGFYERRYWADQVTAQMGQITVKKVDDGVGWAAVHWQYLEDISKVRVYDQTPLRISKDLYTKHYTKDGFVLQPVAGPVAVGDQLVVRIEVRVDRDMEYVHMKDQRPSGCEPVEVLSGYRFQDGLCYYQSTQDTATHFFFDYLPKGTYVFEYSTHVQLRGRYQAGIALIECMYAPEFNSHSEGFELEVR